MASISLIKKIPVTKLKTALGTDRKVGNNNVKL